ncbi:hypothetical protein TNCV_821981 [Trichonephila clavipes]|nr:hypothetical protein TNCV_3676511 [Trichonephila clavipes]GFS99062.1 hypothetical protein TNCV_821981 [Trichonephila clavipes]
MKSAFPLKQANSSSLIILGSLTANEWKRVFKDEFKFNWVSDEKRGDPSFGADGIVWVPLHTTPNMYPRHIPEVRS